MAVVAACFLPACTGSDLLSELGAEAPGLPAVTISPTGGASTPTPQPAAPGSGEGTPSATTVPAAATPTPAPAASTAGVPEEAVAADEAGWICALAERLAAAGYLDGAEKAFRRALEFDDDLPCAREGFQNVLVRRRQSIVLEARASAREGVAKKIAQLTLAVAADYSNAGAYEKLDRVASTYQNRTTRCDLALKAARLELYGIAEHLSEGAHESPCRHKELRDAAREMTASATIIAQARARENDDPALALDLIVTALEVDPSLVVRAAVTGDAPTADAIASSLPAPRGRPTVGSRLDSIGDFVQRGLEALDSLAKLVVFLALLWAALLALLSYVPGLSHLLRWLVRTSRDAPRISDGPVRKGGRWIYHWALEPLRTAYRPRFEVSPPAKAEK